MRIFEPLGALGGALAAAAAALLLPTLPASALDVVPHAAARPPMEAFTSAREALRSGVRDYNAGDKVSAVRALEFAATQGHALALWKLGRMYADGDGVAHDDLRAFEYFSRIADENADEASDSPRAGVVASAFVSLGTYFLEGIKGSYVTANPERAAELFKYAAAYFGDPNAQYNLGRLYQEGTGVDRDQLQAARWFNLAAEKGQHAAQALLGQQLIAGAGMPSQRARGLAWLTLARDGADPKRDSWILDLYAQALETASDTDRRTATALLEQFQAKRH